MFYGWVEEHGQGSMISDPYEAPHEKMDLDMLIEIW